MTDCTNNDLQDLLPEFAAGELPARERELVDVHLVSCAACREEVDVIIAVLNARPLPPMIDVAAIVAALPKPPTVNASVQEPTATPALRVITGGQAGRAPSMQAARASRSVFGSSLLKFAATLTLVAVGGLSVVMSGRGLGSVTEPDVAAAPMFRGDSTVVATLPEPYATDRVPVKAVVSVAPSVLPIQELSDYSDDELALLLERLEAWDGAPPVEPDNVPPATIQSDTAIQEGS
jgi:hypothetical protein